MAGWPPPGPPRFLGDFPEFRRRRRSLPVPPGHHPARSARDDRGLPNPPRTHRFQRPSNRRRPGIRPPHPPAKPPDPRPAGSDRAGGGATVQAIPSGPTGGQTVGLNGRHRRPVRAGLARRIDDGPPFATPEVSCNLDLNRPKPIPLRDVRRPETSSRAGPSRRPTRSQTLIEQHTLAIWRLTAIIRFAGNCQVSGA
jgi:hypothetical protein